MVVVVMIVVVVVMVVVIVVVAVDSDPIHENVRTIDQPRRVLVPVYPTRSRYYLSL